MSSPRKISRESLNPPSRPTLGGTRTYQAAVPPEHTRSRRYRSNQQKARTNSAAHNMRWPEGGERLAIEGWHGSKVTPSNTSTVCMGAATRQQLAADLEGDSEGSTTKEGHGAGKQQAKHGAWAHTASPNSQGVVCTTRRCSSASA